MSLTIWIDNNNVIEWQALTNSVTEAVDTGATMTVTIQDSSGTEVTGQTWPATMTHVSAGLYRATLDSDLVLTAGREYTAVLDVTGTGGEVGHKEIVATARVRNT